MSKFPASAITAADAACFMWVDSYTVAKATELLDEWGFKFHSVYHVLDVAKYPWMEKGQSKKSTEVAKDGMDVANDNEGTPTAEGATAAEPKCTPAGTGESTTEGAPKQKKNMTRKPRAPPINPPH